MEGAKGERDEREREREGTRVAGTEGNRHLLFLHTHTLPFLCHPPSYYMPFPSCLARTYPSSPGFFSVQNHATTSAARPPFPPSPFTPFSLSLSSPLPSLLFSLRFKRMHTFSPGYAEWTERAEQWPPFRLTARRLRGKGVGGGGIGC